MNDKLTITQIQKIMSWSYPTALKFATKNGEFIGGKWYVSQEAVQGKIDELDNSVLAMKISLSQILPAQ